MVNQFGKESNSQAINNIKLLMFNAKLIRAG